MDEKGFAALVAEAIEALPQAFVNQIQNVEIVIEEWPDRETVKLAGVRHRRELMGFYHGIPLPERGANYTLVLPDKISLYRQPILLYCRETGENVREMVHRVLRHEIAHYFGLDDERLREIGAY